METWKHIRAILLLPFTATVVIPGFILWLTGPDTIDLWQSTPAIRLGLAVLGGALGCLGLVVLVATIRLFMTVEQQGHHSLPGTRRNGWWSGASIVMSATR